VCLLFRPKLITIREMPIVNCCRGCRGTFLVGSAAFEADSTSCGLLHFD